MNISRLCYHLGNLCYLFLALAALWGAFCVVLVWRRISQKRFRNEEAQQEFVAKLEEPLEKGAFDQAAALCEGDLRAVPQLTVLACSLIRLGFSKVRQMVVDRFQRDLMADLEYRISWINTMIKVAPMLGLFGTVLGMMGAFEKLSAAENVKPEQLAQDIALALITTADGLAIAIPLIICMAVINIRIRRMEDLAIAGLTRVLDSLHRGMERRGIK